MDPGTLAKWERGERDPAGGFLDLVKRFLQGGEAPGAQHGEERVPLFGDFGLVNQLGSATYARPRKFRERLERWLDLVRMMWPECPVRVSPDGRAIIVKRAHAIRPAGSNHVCA